MVRARWGTPTAIVALLLGASACGGSSSGTLSGSAAVSSTTTPQPTPTPSPTPKPELLFAVLEAHGDHAGFPLLDDTVAIVGVDGVARAKATFDVRPKPVIGNAAPILVPEAHVAAGAVYYVDGHGVVRRLAVGSQPTKVATFGILTAQSEFSFAVSPDGQHLAASAFTYPPLGPPCDTPFCNPFTPGAPYTIDFQTAAAGATPATVRHETRAQDSNPINHVPLVAGWIDSGPLMTTDQAVGTQDTVGDRFWFGDVFTMDETGHPGQLVGGAGCHPWTALHDGTVACADNNSAPNVSVHSAGGTALWSAISSGYMVYLALSADANKLALENLGDPVHDVVESHGSPLITLPAKFHPQGFLDNNTVIGIKSDNPGDLQGEMSLVHLDNPSKVTDLGFAGSFVGVVQSAG